MPEFKLVQDDRKKAGKTMAVSLNSNLGRLLLYRLAYLELEDRRGGPVEFAQLFTAPDEPKKFWIKPCKADDPGAKHVLTTANTRTISAKKLISELKFQAEKTLQFPATWNREHKMLEVDISKPL
ncbi:MAG: hypothetical protein WBG50_22750 [Desulfomonilaceae bacterium]